MPAPNRYLIPRPGNSYSSVEASINLSSWVVISNKEAGMDNNTSGAPPPQLGLFSDSSAVVDDNPPTDTFPEDANNLYVGLSSSTGDGAVSGLSGSDDIQLTHSSWHDDPARPGDDDLFSHVHTLYGQKIASGVTVNMRMLDAYWKTQWAPAWPEGSIGYEIEQVQVGDGQWLAISEPQSLEVRVTHSPTVQNGTVSGSESRGTLELNWGSGILSWSPFGLGIDGFKAAPSIALAAGPGTQVTNLNVNALPTTFTYIVNDLTSCPPYTGLFGGYSSVFGGGIISMVDNATLQVKANVQFDGTYTIRPPRLRWIYGVILPPKFGRYKVNVGTEEVPVWKFMIPQAGENGGVGVGKVNIGNELSPTWVRWDPRMKVNGGTEASPLWLKEGSVE